MVGRKVTKGHNLPEGRSAREPKKTERKDRGKTKEVGEWQETLAVEVKQDQKNGSSPLW